MQRYAKRHPESPHHVLCPFCGFTCTRDTPYGWCSGCFVEYYQGPRGGIVFDTERQTDHFLWAKALQKAGGCRMGTITERDTDGL